MASVVPGFEHDVFVSYATVDNRPDSDPWVRAFVATLRDALAAEVGRLDDQVWWDESHVDEESSLPRQIADRVGSSACLVVVLSKGYVRSQWCRRELETFLSRFDNPADTDAPADTDGRVFLVDIGNLRLEDRPAEFKDIAGRKFFVQPDGTESFDDRYTVGLTKADRDRDSSFFRKIDDLARALGRRLSALKEQSTASESQSSNALPRSPTATAEQPVHPDVTVFLAEPADSVIDEHEQIARFLADYFRIVPEPGPLLTSWLEWSDATRAALEESTVAVQILDGIAGRKIDGHPDGLRVVTAQAELIRASGKPFVAWCPEDAASKKDARLQNLLEHAEFVGENQFQAFKDQILRLAVPVEAEEPEPGPVGVELPPRVFIQFDVQDKRDAEELHSSLATLPCLPLLAEPEGPPDVIRKTTTQRVRECDALILYWGHKASNWVTSQLWNLWDDINNRPRPLRALAVCKGPPPKKSAGGFGFPHDPLVWPDGSESQAIPLSEWVASLGGAR